MSSVQLLDKTRKIEILLHNNNSSKVVFSDICRVMRDVTSSNCLVISRKGKILGTGFSPKITAITELLGEKNGAFIDTKLNERLLSILSTKENVNFKALGFVETDCTGYHAIVTPIIIAGVRLGTLFLYRNDSEYEIDDIILCEYATTVVGLELLRSENEENAEETRKISSAQSAIGTLSVMEQEAIVYVFNELDGNEGMLVASKIADRVGITRSVIVNGLRKLESAGVIETKSAGMKGTYIKIVNDAIFDELKV